MPDFPTLVLHCESSSSLLGGKYFFIAFYHARSRNILHLSPLLWLAPHVIPPFHLFVWPNQKFIWISRATGRVSTERLGV